jgi:hypothetical protein
VTIGQKVRIVTCDHAPDDFVTENLKGTVATVRYIWTHQEPAYTSHQHGVRWPEKLFRVGLTNPSTGLALCDLLPCQLEVIP